MPNLSRLPCLLALIFYSGTPLLRAQAPQVPDWALPGSPTHKQVPPPDGFQRPVVNFEIPIGIFSAQSDIGGPLLPGSASYDAKTKAYTITSAGYNIWYFRDEFRFLWNKVSGDVSLAADISFPDPTGFFDRKAVLVIRQDLDDNSKKVVAALHGGGMIHLAVRSDKGGTMTQPNRMKVPPSKPGEKPIRIGIEKQGNTFALFVSKKGEPMQQTGPTIELPFDGPFYVGIGFCSHIPDKSDTAILTDVVFENAAGKIH